MEKGDVLFNNTNSVELVGKSALAHEPIVCAFSNHITRLRVVDTKSLDPAWLLICLRQFFVNGFFAANCNRWIGQAGFAATKLAQLEIPLPPLEIQRRIVLRLESLLGEVSEARKLQEKIEKDTGQVFNAYSKQVFEDIEEKYSTHILEPLTTKIGSGSTPRGGKSVYLSSGIPFVRSLNVRWNEFTTQDLAFIDSDIHQRMKGTEVLSGDVFLNITGASIGRSCCVPSELCPANVNQHVMIIRPIQEQLRSRFLMYWLTSPNTQDFIINTQAGATRQALTKTQVQNLNVPLPPTDVQDYFVNYFDSVASELADMQKAQSENAELLTQMEQSILGQAFRGEL